MCLGMGWTVTAGAKLTLFSVALCEPVEEDREDDRIRRPNDISDALGPSSSSPVRETWKDSSCQSREGGRGLLAFAAVGLLVGHSNDVVVEVIPRRFRNLERSLAAQGAGATALGGDDKESNDSDWLIDDNSEKEFVRWRLLGDCCVFGCSFRLRLFDSSIRRLGDNFVRATMS